MDKEDYSYLKTLRPDWWKTQDSLISVASILDYESIFPDTESVIQFFSKPWRWETEIKELIQEVIEISIMEDFRRLNKEDEEEAVEWLLEFGFEEDFIDLLTYRKEY